MAAGGEGVDAPVQLRRLTCMCMRYLVDFCGTECPIRPNITVTIS